ncbi:YusU family protein [Bacillus carboniphilus]|uniref:YusU family protein n=1 Tax=Bacillus carboniphilus TaxID=86663 RepID=A0ABP3FY22_9BACI
MTKDVQEKFQALLQKYSELLIGENDDQSVDEVKMWALYSHIAKTMPPLVKHWNEMYPDAKEELKRISFSIKEKNQNLRNKKD